MLLSRNKRVPIVRNVKTDAQLDLLQVDLFDWY